MVRYKSHGGKKPTAVEERASAVKAGVIFLVIVAVFVLGIIFVPKLGLFSSNEEENVTTSEQCGAIIPNSVFSTGDPLLDQRILWVITYDESKGKEVAGNLVDHIWQEGNFSFPEKAEKDLWKKAVSTVTSVEKGIEEPALSITQDGVIIPYKAGPEARSLSWTEVSVSGIPAQKSTFLMSSAIGEKTSSPVPTVLLSINGGTLVPSPTLGVGAEHTAVDTKEVC